MWTLSPFHYLSEISLYSSRRREGTDNTPSVLHGYKTLSSKFTLYISFAGGDVSLNMRMTASLNVQILPNPKLSILRKNKNLLKELRAGRTTRIPTWLPPLQPLRLRLRASAAQQVALLPRGGRGCGWEATDWPTAPVGSVGCCLWSRYPPRWNVNAGNASFHLSYVAMLRTAYHRRKNASNWQVKVTAFSYTVSSVYVCSFILPRLLVCLYKSKDYCYIVAISENPKTNHTRQNSCFNEAWFFTTK